MPALPDNTGQDLVLDHPDIPAVDIESLQPRIEIDAKPLPGEDRIRVGAIKFQQTVAERARAIGQPLLPVGFERIKVDRAVDLLDQIVLAWKVTIEQRLGHAEPSRKGPCSATKTLFRKKLGCFRYEFPTAFVRRKPRLLRTTPFGLFFPA